MTCRFGKTAYRLTASLVLLLTIVAQPVSAEAPAAKIAIGPYVQNPASDGMTVMFCAEAPGQFAVEYGLANDRLDGRVVAQHCSPEAPWPHKARIEGLKPGSQCFYRIVNADNGEAVSAVESFTTLNPRADSVTAVFLNDLHINLRLMEALRPRWQDVDPDFVLFNGDCWNNPERVKSVTALERFVALCPAARRPMLLLRGNHEWRGSWQDGLMGCFDLPLAQQKKYYFAFTQGPVRFVCLDCGEDCHKEMDLFQPYREEQLEWIKAELASDEFRRAKYRVLVMHIGLYGDPPQEGNTSMPCHEMWSPVLDKAGIDLCIAAHAHVAKLLMPDDPGTHRSADGSRTNPYAVLVGGGPALQGPEAGTVMILEAGAEELRVRCIGVDGRTIYEYRQGEKRIGDGP